MKDNIGGKITIPIPTTLFIVFLILKLTNTIDWPWWTVFAPIWAPFVILILYVIVGLIFAIFGFYNRDKF